MLSKNGSSCNMKRPVCLVASEIHAHLQRVKPGRGKQHCVFFFFISPYSWAIIREHLISDVLKYTQRTTQRCIRLFQILSNLTMKINHHRVYQEHNFCKLELYLSVLATLINITLYYCLPRMFTFLFV